MIFTKKIIPEGSLTERSFKKLKSNTIALGSIIVISSAIFIALMGYLITPDSTPFANEQHLELAAAKPGFSVMMLTIQKNETIRPTSFIGQLISGRQSSVISLPISGYEFKGNHIIVYPYDKAGYSADSILPLVYNLTDVVYALADTSHVKKIPSKDLNGIIIKNEAEFLKNLIKSEHIIKRHFLLGTDRFGRDMLSQLMIGTRVSLSVGLISVLISLILGITLGAMAGYYRGWIDEAIMWFINVVWSVPTLLLVIAITFALGKGFWQVFIAVGLTMWVEVARIVRGQILSLREKEFIEAAQALGYKNPRIILRHILPNAMGPVIVISAANFASAILIEAGLSFLGIGVQPPMPSWGTMVKENYAFIILENPWLALLPGICIMLLVLAFMLIGNSLRDALDVKEVQSN